MYSPIIEKLIKAFSRFPTIGPRTANRFVFYLLHLEKKEIEELISFISELKEKVKLCLNCYKSFDLPGQLCEICQNNQRDKSLICVIEKETDLISIEKTKKYQGLYFILDNNNIRKTRIKELLKKVEKPEIKEIIIALNPTIEKETISLYLERKLKTFNKKITRLGRGMPTGGELEYADEETISSALENRK
jgi:recombination protein RecR